MGKLFRRIISLATCLSIALLPIETMAATATRVLPEGTRVYLKLDELVSGKRGDAEEGDIAPCSVWRDVDLQGVVLVKSGTRANCKVESVKHANIVGIKGKLVIAALDTKTSDGQELQLTGGYNKEGKSRMALSISLGVILFLPLAFITGSPAVLPEGTIFDVYTGPDTPVKFDVAFSTSAPTINLSGQLGPLSAEILLDEFKDPDAKPELFRIHVSKRDPSTPAFVIDSVNGKSVEALPLEVAESNVVDGSLDAILTIKIKTLGKHFQKGINRFEVAYDDNGQRVGTEVILNIQI